MYGVYESVGGVWVAVCMECMRVWVECVYGVYESVGGVWVAVCMECMRVCVECGRLCVTVRVDGCVCVECG